MTEGGAFGPISARRYGAHGLLFEFASDEEVMRAYQHSRGGDFDECVPGARTLYIESMRRSTREIDRDVRKLFDAPHNFIDSETVRTHIIDVCYDGEDLDNVAEMTGLTVGEVIRLHCGASYTVAFLGFSRSFPYLRGLDPALHVGRRAVPRTVVPAGSVAMGAGFTGIYPMASPGGWQLLGHTDAILFDAMQDPPSALATGDLVRFLPISGAS
jgi:KipI family sensor histidine kinase inhibitor